MQASNNTDLENMFPELSDRERMLYASQGRMYEAIMIWQGLPPMPDNLRNEAGYIILWLEFQDQVFAEGENNE